MANKRPWKVQPNLNGRQAYAYEDANGVSWVRQSLRTEDGRVLWFDLSPEEAGNLIQDLETARMDIVAHVQLFGGSGDNHPEARF